MVVTRICVVCTFILCLCGNLILDNQPKTTVQMFLSVLVACWNYGGGMDVWLSTLSPPQHRIFYISSRFRSESLPVVSFPRFLVLGIVPLHLDLTLLHTPGIVLPQGEAWHRFNLTLLLLVPFIQSSCTHGSYRPASSAFSRSIPAHVIITPLSVQCGGGGTWSWTPKNLVRESSLERRS